MKKNQEFGDGGEIPNLVLFYLRYPFGQQFSNILLKRSAAFELLEKLRKFGEIRLDSVLGPLKTRKNHVFSVSSHPYCWKFIIV